MTTVDDAREVRLHIANTQELHLLALRITDFKLDGEQINDLLAATCQQIVRNGGEQPQMLTDKQVRELQDAVRAEVYELQAEAQV